MEKDPEEGRVDASRDELMALFSKVQKGNRQRRWFQLINFPTFCIGSSVAVCVMLMLKSSDALRMLAVNPVVAIIIAVVVCGFCSESLQSHFREYVFFWRSAEYISWPSLVILWIAWLVLFVSSLWIVINQSYLQDIKTANSRDLVTNQIKSDLNDYIMAVFSVCCTNEAHLAEECSLSNATACIIDISYFNSVSTYEDLCAQGTPGGSTCMAGPSTYKQSLADYFQDKLTLGILQLCYTVALFLYILLLSYVLFTSTLQEDFASLDKLIARDRGAVPRELLDKFEDLKNRS